MKRYSLLDIDPTPTIVYSGLGRICHGYTFERGSFTMDDFGNAVYVDPIKIGMHIGQEH